MPGAKGIPSAQAVAPPNPPTRSSFNWPLPNRLPLGPRAAVSSQLCWCLFGACQCAHVHVRATLRKLAHHEGGVSVKERTGNSGGSVRWIFSGWHLSIPLCVWSLPTVTLCVSLILSGLYYGPAAQWTPIWRMRTPILPRVHQTYCGSLQRLGAVVGAGFGGVRTGDLAETGWSVAARQSSKVTKHKDGMGERRVIGAMGY